MISSNHKEIRGELFYDQAWEYWSDMIKYSPAPRHRRRIIKKFLTELKFNSLIDIGCGDSFFLHEISRKFQATLAGIDISPHIIARNKQRFSEIDFYRLSVEDSLVETAGQYDVVIYSEVIEHT